MFENDYDALRHILKACESIERFTKDVERNDLYENEMLALAIVRLIEVIGEAARRLSSDLTAANPQVEWAQIVATRNRLIHGYFDIDLDIVWTIASADIPVLRSEVQRILHHST